MALFSNKKAVKKAAPAAEAKDASKDRSGILVRPWFSEKALIGTEKGVYVFVVPPTATKHDVAAAVETVYKVKPRKVRIANLPAKTQNLRARRGVGTRARRHKAYVYLKKGETIALA